MAEGTEPTVEPLEGKTTIDDKMFFEPERLSYVSAGAIAREIAQAVKKDVINKTVVLAGTDLLSAFAKLQAAKVSIEILIRDYKGITSLAQHILGGLRVPSPAVAVAAEDVVSAAVSAAIAPATALVNASLGLLGLFREDVEYHGAKTTVDELAFEIVLAARLKEAGATKVIVPDLMVISTTSTTETSLGSRLAMVQKAKADAWAAVGPTVAWLAQLEEKLDQAAREENRAEFDRLTRVISELRREMQPISDPLARCDQQLGELYSHWSKVHERSGLSELAHVLRAEVIQDLDPAYVHAKVVSSGGHHRISRSLLSTIFVGDGLSFAGGSVARWALLDKSVGVKNGGILVGRARASSLS